MSENSTMVKNSRVMILCFYGSELQNIIANPDYAGKNTKEDSIEFTKEYFINGEYSRWQ